MSRTKFELKFNSFASFPAIGNTHTLYIATNNNKIYRWNWSSYVETPTWWIWDVVWPASATDNALTRFDWTTGKLLQNSSATLDDNWNLSAAAGSFTTLTATSNIRTGWTIGSTGTSLTIYWDNAITDTSVVIRGAGDGIPNVIQFRINGNVPWTITTTGLNSCAIGATTASTGAFTTISATNIISQSIANSTAAPANAWLYQVLGNTQAAGHVMNKIDTGTSSQGHKAYVARITNASTSAVWFEIDWSTTFQGKWINFLTNWWNNFIGIDFSTTNLVDVTGQTKYWIKFANIKSTNSVSSTAYWLYYGNIAVGSSWTWYWIYFTSVASGWGTSSSWYWIYFADVGNGGTIGNWIHFANINTWWIALYNK